VGILLAVLLTVGHGLRRGFWLSLAQYAGMVVGVVAGAALAPRVTDLLGITGASVRPLAAGVVLLIGGLLGSTVGYAVGAPLRLMLLARPGRARLDSLFGALFSVLSVLVTAWFLGLTFSRGPSPDLARLIQRSVILRALDDAAPRPPGFLARVERILAGVPFPQTFSGLEPLLPPAMSPLPDSVNTPGVQAAARATVKVEGRGCGGIVSGSGFPVGTDEVLTNAHVVAGTRGTTVSILPGRTLRGTVVLFDPNRDVAIVRVPGLGLTALAQASAGRGTHGAAIGYPGGGPEVVAPAVVDTGVRATGRDIYGNQLVTRQIWIIEASIHPGDSGGPLVDTQGHVIGVIFAASTSQPGQAYALTNAETQPDIDAAQGRQAGVGTGSCAV
jgi:S1-C subfamily serine protease